MSRSVQVAHVPLVHLFCSLRSLATGFALFLAATASAQSNLPPPVTVYSFIPAGYRFRIPSLVTCTNGTLLAFAEGRRGNAADFGDIDLVVKRSTNNGATWDPLQVVGDYKAMLNVTNDLVVGNPTAVVDRNTGRVILLAMTGDASENSIQAGVGSRRVWVTDTADNGITWSAWREITSSVKPAGWRGYATGPGHGIQLQNGIHAGRLIIPVAYTTGTNTNPADYFLSTTCIVSDDDGQNWQLGAVDSTQPNYLKASETSVVELTGTTNGNSRLYFNTRDHLGSSTGHRGYAYSFDSGSSFTGPFKPGLDFVAALCEGSLLRVNFPETNGSPGRIVFSCPNSVGFRKWLSLWTSRDETASWSLPKRVWNGPSGYSDMTLTATGDIALLFEDLDSGLRLLTINPAWLDTPIPASERPNEGFWTFSNFAAGSFTTAGVVNILDVSPAGYGLNMSADGAFPFVQGPTNSAGSAAISFNETGGLWLYPNSIGNPFDFGPDDSFTVETLVRVPATETFGALVSKIDWVGQVPAWWMRVQDGGKVVFLIGDSTGKESYVRTAQLINNGQWHEVVAVRDAVARQLRIYVDGTLSAQAGDTTTGSLANGRAMTIGRYTTYASGNLRGDIDYVRITPQALDPGLFFHWQFACDSLVPDTTLHIFTTNTVNANYVLSYLTTTNPSNTLGFVMSQDLIHWTNQLPSITYTQQILPVCSNYTRLFVLLRDERPAPQQSLFFRLTAAP